MVLLTGQGWLVPGPHAPRRRIRCLRPRARAVGCLLKGYPHKEHVTFVRHNEQYHLFLIWLTFLAFSCVCRTYRR